jgi:Na+/proline symporter
MSTISTQLNLGASYLVNDFYRRFISPDASEQKLVWAGRLFTVITMLLGSYIGLKLTDAGEAFDLLLLLGAGTGLIYILRWFWWRINAYTEIIAMVSSLIIAYYLTFEHNNMGFWPLLAWQKTVVGVLLTTGIWIIATYFTPQTDSKTLFAFYRLIRPGGPGWKHITDQLKTESKTSLEGSEDWKVPLELLATAIGCFTVFGILFATGYWIYGKYIGAAALTAGSIIGVVILFRIWRNLKVNMLDDTIDNLNRET